MNRSAWSPWLVLVLVLVLLVGAGVVVSWGWGGGYGWGMMGPGMMGGWLGMPLLGPIFMLVTAGLVIGGLVWFVQVMARGASGTGGGRPGVETPLEIAKRRFASGEITKDQFEDIRRTLESG